jgi:nitrite reductase/ring-hydroxylating ferredoxin subunit
MIRLCRTADVPPGNALAIEIPGQEPVAVYNVDGTFYVTDDRCSHAEASLGEGILTGPIIECPFHGGTFDVRTGTAVELPCTKPVRTYAVTIRVDEVWMEES